MAKPEWSLQIHCHKLARDFITVPHKFMAFDRARADGAFSHEYQRRRGVKAGTPDTLLRVQGFPNIWCEMKAPGNKPTDAQLKMGADLIELGDHWFWTDSVRGYLDGLHTLDVPLMRSAWIAVEQSEAALRLHTAAHKPRSTRPRKKPLTAAGRKAAATYARLMP